jgi:hypothetical protein
MALSIKEISRLVASSSKISEQARNDIFDIIMADKSLSPRLVRLLKLHDIIDLEIKEPTKPLLLYSTLPLSIFDYLSDSESYCYHPLFTMKGCYDSINIGAHAKTSDCLVVNHAKAKAIARNWIANSSFGILLNSYAIRHLEHYNDGSIIVVCYGLNHRFPIKGADN